MENPTQKEIDDDFEFCVHGQLVIRSLMRFVEYRNDADDSYSLIARGLAMEIENLVDSVSRGTQTIQIDGHIDVAFQDYFDGVGDIER